MPAASTLDAYWLTGAAWVDGSALLVNHEFDFALGFADENGAMLGIAAARRLESNRETARRLERLGALDVAERVATASASARRPACSARVPSGGRFRAFALLFGRPEAQLRVVWERIEDGRVVGRIVHLSRRRPLEGAGSWTIRALLDDALDDSARLVARHIACVEPEPDTALRSYAPARAGVPWSVAASEASTAVQLDVVPPPQPVLRAWPILTRSDRTVLRASSSPATVWIFDDPGDAPTPIQ